MATSKSSGGGFWSRLGNKVTKPETAAAGGFDDSGAGDFYPSNFDVGDRGGGQQGGDSYGYSYGGDRDRDVTGDHFNDDDAPYGVGPYTGQIFQPQRQTYTPSSSSQQRYSDSSFDHEPPLLEELGVDFGRIWEKTLTVLHPARAPPQGGGHGGGTTMMKETDLAGPAVFCLAFGATLLLAGKVQFGYVYMISVLGTAGMYVLLNLMGGATAGGAGGVSLGCVASVLGYCLLPMVLLSGCGVFVSLRGPFGAVLATAVLAWCSFSASKIFASVLADADGQQALVAYPCALLYGVFALISVF